MEGMPADRPHRNRLALAARFARIAVLAVAIAVAFAVAAVAALVPA